MPSSKDTGKQKSVRPLSLRDLVSLLLSIQTQKFLQILDRLLQGVHAGEHKLLRFFNSGVQLVPRDLEVGLDDLLDVVSNLKFDLFKSVLVLVGLDVIGIFIGIVGVDVLDLEF